MHTTPNYGHMLKWYVGRHCYYVTKYWVTSRWHLKLDRQHCSTRFPYFPVSSSQILSCPPVRLGYCVMFKMTNAKEFLTLFHRLLNLRRSPHSFHDAFLQLYITAGGHGFGTMAWGCVRWALQSWVVAHLPDSARSTKVTALPRDCWKELHIHLLLL